MSSKDDKNKDTAGFAGLSSLVSDVEIDTDVPKSASAPSAFAKQEPPEEVQNSETNAQQGCQPQPTAQTYQAPAQPSGNSGWKWVLGIGAVIAVIWMAGSGNNNQTSPSYKSSPSAPSYSPPAAKPAVPGRLSEELPPVGTNNVLSSTQLRYCLAEDIRLESAKKAVNSYIDAHVDRFNGMVSDYNSRCGQFRYRKGALESARSEVERYRADLQTEGRGRFSTGTSTAAKAKPQAGKPTPDPTVKSIQQRLNVLGYNVGPADGLMGNGTRTAILAFQRDKGIAVTGVADHDLLMQLQRAVPIANRSTISDANRSLSATTPSVSNLPTPSPSGNTRPGVPSNAWVSGSNWYCNDGYRKVGDKCEALNVPANAWVSGSNWYCNDGYRKVGDKCEKLNVPSNAWVSGSNWYCNDGYRKVGDKCEALNVPANAWVSGPNWYCNDGYRKVSDKCEKLNIPSNAWVSGSNWYCNDGYRKAGDKCISIFDK